jgi:ribose 5-phosphate isomerase A
MQLNKQDKLKQKVAIKALDYIVPNSYIGVGTGSTVNFFIDALASRKNDILGAISSSEESTKRLKNIGVDVFDMNEIDAISVYFDGADEVDENLSLTKGGGGALMREKIVAALADKFVCIVDKSKLVTHLGGFPIPIEVVPMARSAIARYLVKKYQAEPVYRSGYKTDNGNVILDVHCLDVSNPEQVERELNQIPGLVCNGVFYQQSADIVLIADENTVVVKEHQNF